MRICVVAEHASTRFGGEAYLPVHYFRLLRARGIETWLVVHSRTQAELTELFPHELDRMIFVRDLWIHKLLFQISRLLPRRISETTFGLLNQFVTQYCQRQIVRKLIREQGIDVVHQPIPIAPRYPSLLFGMGVPVVSGPLNGGMEYPPAFRGNESAVSRTAVAFFRKFSDLANTLLPGKKQASVLLVANERTRLALPSGVSGVVIQMVENGIDLTVWKDPAQMVEARKSEPRCANPRFVFIGRLVDWKAADVAIRALAKIPHAELDMVGDGAMRETWETLAEDLGLKDRVHFLGWRSQKEYAVLLGDSVALVLPSLFESGGAVVLEAMASARPAIATNWGGPADYIDASCGVLVDPVNYAALVDGFAEAMRRLIDAPELAQAMGAAGRERAVLHFDWQRRIDKMIGIYSALAEKRQIPTGDVRTESRAALQQDFQRDFQIDSQARESPDTAAAVPVRRRSG